MHRFAENRWTFTRLSSYRSFLFDRDYLLWISSSVFGLSSCEFYECQILRLEGQISRGNWETDPGKSNLKNCVHRVADSRAIVGREKRVQSCGLFPTFNGNGGHFTGKKLGN